MATRHSGPIGYGDRIDYGAIGSVTNLAARLCAEARGGEVLISARTVSNLPGSFRTESVGPLALKGFHERVEVKRLVAVDDETKP